MMNFDDAGRFYYVNALCLPHFCGSSEIREYIEIILRKNGIERYGPLLSIPENECVTSDPLVWTPTDWGAL